MSRPGVAALVLVLLASLAGCTGSRNQVAVLDDQFGHRYEASHAGRYTLAITPADPSVAYFYYPAVVESLHVRHEPFNLALPADAQLVEAELLLKGVLPDQCSELHRFDQRRTGHILHVTLEMRRPTGRVCGRLAMPFRFYVPLDGEYGPGDYTVKLNDTVFPFVIRPQEPE